MTRPAGVGVLGRVVNHDPRSRRFAHPEADPATLVSKAWTRRIPVLDQGSLGSCTGNAAVGHLGSDPIYPTIPASQALDEDAAVRIYSAAERIDGGSGYPPQDDGSSGLSVAKACKNAELISAYTHAFSFTALLTMLQGGPCIVGVNWYDSMDYPDSRGHVTVSGDVLGGHEFEVIGADLSARTLECVNSWGTGWGDQGRFTIGFDDMTRLLSEQGDATQFVAILDSPTPPAPAPAPGAASFPGASAVADANVHRLAAARRMTTTEYLNWRFR